MERAIVIHPELGIVQAPLVARYVQKRGNGGPSPYATGYVIRWSGCWRRVYSDGNGGHYINTLKDPVSPKTIVRLPKCENN